MAKLLSIFNSKKTPNSLFILILICIVLESVTRIVFRPRFIPEQIYTQYSPKYDYGFDENESLFYVDDDKLVLYPTQYLDFWKQEMSRVKRPNTQRIFTIGSSVSRGDFQTSYSNYLEQYLNSENSSEKYEVVNCSGTGIGSSRILLIFKKILPYDPDLVIFHLHGSNEFEDERDLAEAKRLQSSYEGIIRKSRFFCVLKKYVDKHVLEKFEAKAEIDDETYNRWFVPGKREEWFNTLKKNTAEIVRIARENKVPILFVNRIFRSDTIPDFEDQESKQFNAVNREFVQKNVSLLDTPALFAEYFGLNADKDSIFLDTVHLKPIGHQLIARKIVDMIQNDIQLPETEGYHSNKLTTEAVKAKPDELLMN